MSNTTSNTASKTKIKDCTRELINAILESDRYQHYLELQKRVKEQPELRSQINDFRSHVFAVQNSEEPLDMYDEQQRLCRLYEEFRRNTLVNEYLSAELGICRMLQKIIADITGSIDLDTEGVADRIDV